MFSREDDDEPPAGVNELVRVYGPRSARSPTATSSPVGTATRGVIGKILPQEDMPFLEDGTRSTSS